MSKLPARVTNLQFRLTSLFALMGAGFTLLVSSYWVQVLEPRLLADAKASAGALAQSQSHNLSDALTLAVEEGDETPLRDAMDEVLVLTDPSTDQPFVVELEVMVDYELVKVPVGSLDLRRGAPCANCFESRLPLYDSNTSELLAIATFRSSNAFFEEVREEVRSRLLAVAVGALVLLWMTWRAVSGLFRKVRASEQAASQAMRAKSEFLATMSHEIRTPMNGVMGMVSLLRETALKQEQREYVDAIAVSADALLVLLDDILDLSKIEAGKLTLEKAPCDLRKQLHDIYTLLSTRVRDKGITLRLVIEDAIPPMVMGDPVRVRQILLNLIGNAVKFTDQGSITTEVRLLAGDPTTGILLLQFSVADTGVGISPEQKARLFEKFSQADSTITRKFGGTGLGLAICKRLVEAMGGTIGLDSEEGKGSRFFFEVPMEVASETAPTPPATETKGPSELRPLRVLVAEDGDINRKVAKALLEKEGHQVIEAKDGQEAVDAVMSQVIDVVLMDLQMPNMDGMEATRRIRALADRRRATLPIIALTANALKEEHDAALEAGMDGFITKPFKPAQLQQEMARFFGAEPPVSKAR